MDKFINDFNKEESRIIEKFSKTGRIKYWKNWIDKLPENKTQFKRKDRYTKGENYAFN